MVDRLSTSLIYSLLSRNVTDNQSDIYKLSKQINLGKKFTAAYDDPVSIIGSIDTQGRISKNDQGIRDRNTATSDLEAQEISLRSMNDIIDKINEIAIKGGTGSVSTDERLILKDELSSLADTIIQLSNSKNGSKFIFSGEQSDLQTLRLQEGSTFDQVIYKHNQDNSKERASGGLTSSVSVKDALVSAAQGAFCRNNVINPIATAAGNLVFETDDGNGTIVNFTAAIASGDDLSTIISKINTAFTGAGGLGSLAQESPAGYLKLDTANITGNTANSDARISLKNTSTTALVKELGVSTRDNFGKDMGLMNTIASLVSALSSNDDSAIRGLLNNIKSNSKQINAVQSQVGLLIAQAERLNSAGDDLDIKLQSDLSTIQDIDMVDANMQLANAQAALQTAIKTTSNFFSKSLGDFLG